MSKLALLGGNPVRTKPYIKWPFFDEKEEQAVLEVIRSGKWWRYEGDKVLKFEQQFANAHDAKFGIAVTNGTAALEIALAAMGVRPGDEVIVPSYTFVATATAVIANGATPVFVDIEPDTYNLDPVQVEQAISEKTKVIIPVHFAGYPADMDRLMEIACKHNILVLEDAAHAHGGAYKGKKLGSIGHASGFSFQASKNMTSGEGGIVLSNDEELAAKVFSIHTFGRTPGRPWYEHHLISTNKRMTEMQAAILLIQLNRLSSQTEERAKNAEILDRGIGSIGELSLMKLNDQATAKRAYHLYLLKYSPGIEGVSRDLFLKAVQAEGVSLASGYIVPLYKQPLFGKINLPKGQNCPFDKLYQPNVEKAVCESLWIPQNVLLGDKSGVEDIISAFEKVISNADELRKTNIG